MSSNLNSQDPEAVSSAAERQAQALYDFLHGLLPQDDPDVPAGEAELGKALRALADETQPGEEFDASLQEVLQAEARRGRSKAAVGRSAPCCRSPPGWRPVRKFNPCWSR